jgi:hypothetical protein
MTLRNKLQSCIRGWFPHEPIIGTIRSTQSSTGLNRWVGLPCSTIGALMVAASLLSVVFGTALVSFYLMLPPLPGGSRILFSGLCAGILNLGAFAVGLYSGILFLARKQITRAVIGMCVVLAFGLVTLLLPIFEGIPAQSGLLVASPMVVFPVAALCIAGFKIRNKKTELTIQKEPPAIGERVFAGLATGGSGLIGLGIFFFLVPIYPKEEVVIVTLVIGIPLLMAALYVKKTTKEHEGT